MMGKMREVIGISELRLCDIAPGACRSWNSYPPLPRAYRPGDGSYGHRKPDGSGGSRRGGSRDKALFALLAHPLIMDYDIAGPLLEDLPEANREFFPAFFLSRPAEE